MYEELIERLKEDAEWAEANEWESPITLGDNIREAADAIKELEQKLSKIPPYPKCKGCGVGVDDTLPQLCDDISQCYVYTKRNYFCLEEENKKLRAELEDVKREREKWISVGDKLPDKNGAYLVYARGFRILEFNNNLEAFDDCEFEGCNYPGFFDYDSEEGLIDCTKNTTHWMPFPQVPKEDAE